MKILGDLSFPAFLEYILLKPPCEVLLSRALYFFNKAKGRSEFLGIKQQNIQNSRVHTAVTPFESLSFVFVLLCFYSWFLHTFYILARNKN